MRHIHISLNVRDLDAAVDFYRRLLGAEPAKRRPGYAKFRLDDPPLNLALNEAEGPRLSHLGVEVDAEEHLAAARARTEAAGLRLREEEEAACCYAVQRKFWADDPDGNAWEFFRVLGDSPVRGGACCG